MLSPKTQIYTLMIQVFWDVMLCQWLPTFWTDCSVLTFSDKQLQLAVCPVAKPCTAEWTASRSQYICIIPLTFCWPCITIYQCSETNMMHFLFNLLRLKGFYMFQALLAHLQEMLHKQHLVYCMCVMSIGCTRTGVVQPTDITCMKYTKCRLYSTSWGWASNTQNI
jgi:hypothetical protein